jgi:DNA polymerase-1
MNPKAPHARCSECPLRDRPFVPSTRPKRLPAKGAIVSRSPGNPEVRAGEHFASAQGSRKILDHLLNANGVNREEVLLTNVVLCAVPEGKVPPEAIKACAPRLRSELEHVGTIVACGSEAVNLLVGPGAIDRYRGYRIDRNGSTVIATNNPALVLHDDSSFPNLKRDFKRAFRPQPPPTLPEVEIVTDIRTARNILRDASRHEYVACDIESRGGLSHTASLICFQLATSGVYATVFSEQVCGQAEFLDALRAFLESGRTNCIWHGGKFDCKILRHRYRIKARVDHDTMLLSYALDERSGTDERVGVHGLDYLLMDTFGWPYYSSPAVERAKKTGIVEDYDEFYRYAGLDAGGTYQLFHDQWPRAEKDNVVEPYEHLLLRGTELAINIELNGMVYDAERAADVHEFEVAPELDELENQLRKLAANPILNPHSPQQMAHLLYGVWGIDHAMRKRPDMYMSVDESARIEIMEGRFKFRGDTKQVRHGNMIKLVPAEDAAERRAFYIDFVERFNRARKLQKQSTNYLVGMIKRAEASADSRIHTQLNFHGTNSGRLSSSKPNLQNITRTKEGLPDIRKLFRASSGRQIVQADFSQAELRCIAQFSGDTELTRIYANDLSLHRETATRFYGADYTYEQYSTCKNVNFGVFYKQGADTFQEKHGIPQDKAQEYIDWVWQTFTGVAEWEAEVEREVKAKGVLVSPFGRKRRFHLLTRENLQEALRQGINFYPQSTASDLTLCSAITLSGEIDPSLAAITILVHDSIVGDVVESYVDEYSTICEQVMSSVAYNELGWTLPFHAELSVGENWGQA